MEIKGSVCLVTGATSGIGRATAVALADRGARLVATGRNVGALAALEAEAGARTIRLDLAEHDAPVRLVQQAGRVDVLVAAAGRGLHGPVVELDRRELEEVVALNLVSTIALVREVLPGMLRRGHGHVAVIGSIAGRVGHADEAAYAATKGGLGLFVDSLRDELFATGVSASLVTPGVVDTPFFERRGALYDRTWPRPIEPARVADAVVRAIEAERREVTVPEWLNLAARARDAAPSLYRAFSARFG